MEGYCKYTTFSCIKCRAYQPLGGAKWETRSTLGNLEVGRKKFPSLSLRTGGSQMKQAKNARFGRENSRTRAFTSEECGKIVTPGEGYTHMKNPQTYESTECMKVYKQTDGRFVRERAKPAHSRTKHIVSPYRWSRSQCHQSLRTLRLEILP